MIDGDVSGSRTPRGIASSSVMDRATRPLVLSRLRQLRAGRIRVVDGGETLRFGDGGDNALLQATIEVHDSRFYREVLLGGSLGAADAYTQGWWSADDLTAVLRMFASDAEAAGRLERGLARLGGTMTRLVHAWRANTRRGSRRNIRAHYDLGNAFFSRFLDESLTYSCALFTRPDMSLEQAQREKLDHVCRKLGLVPGEHVLETGTGWGSFAMHAARAYGCRVTTTTVSPAQYELASARVRDAGLADRVDVRLEDYRDVDGLYDKLVSIEMIEAVGERFLETYLDRCSRLLRPAGAMLLQAIVISDRKYDAYRRSTDFIRTCVFPGGFLPSRGSLFSSIARATDLRVTDLEDLTPHYVTTLREWRRRFRDNAAAVRGMGCPETLLRLWDYYLCYSEAGFAERTVGDVQVLLAKPGWRGEAVRLGARADADREERARS
jgi:cyclopropane-fatty-acyl-phospholipid synthase